MPRLIAAVRRLAAGGSAVLQIAGLATVAIGVGLIYPPAGVIAAGAAIFALGLVVGLPARRR